MPDKRHHRRFIAGAVCPSCGLTDKIVVDADTDRRLCVSCGFSEERPGLPASPALTDAVHIAAELPTRVSRAAARRVQTPAQPIRLIDIASNDDKPRD